ncbi:MAG: PIN domain-containing protein [Saprospiraceae bacterium]|nr:PIN domain-containing protein [Saprospiraceae bacterium]
MIHSVKFTCVLDTNVIYPLEVRDLLFWFAHYELYTPKWSSEIFDEWKKVMERKGLPHAEIAKRIEKANKAFPDALVRNYESLIASLHLPDERDCHVLAAAIKTNAQVIVTNNLKDFPPEILEQYGITAKNADDFLTDIIDLNHEMALEAFQKMVLNRKNPELDQYQVLDALRKNGLIETANYLHALL